MKEQLKLIRNSRVVTADGIEVADILVQGQWIIAVGPDLSSNGAKVIEAGDLYAIPGAIDAHVHLRDPGAIHKEDFTTGTRAALSGGVTTVLDMPNNPLPTITPEAFREKVALGREKSCCDFGLFIGATAENFEAVAGVKEAVGLKLYMGSSTGGLLVSDLETQYRHFSSYPAYRPLAVHAEDEDAVRLFSDAERRPPICAELSVARAIALARRTRRRLHVCHISTQVELEAITWARKQGVAVTCEVTPHHLFLSREDEARLGPFAIMNPPLRSLEDQKALWRNLAAIDMVASDHAPHTVEEKESAAPPSGVPGLETSLLLLLDAAAKGRLAFPHLVHIVATRPASVFQLPHKGRIHPGFHADIVLVDLSQNTVLGHNSYGKSGWSPFRGREVQGKIQHVFLRGQDAFVEGKITVEPGFGCFLSPQYS